MYNGETKTVHLRRTVLLSLFENIRDNIRELIRDLYQRNFGIG